MNNEYPIPSLDQQMRAQALDMATRLITPTSHYSDVLAAAEKFYEFMKGPAA